MTNILILDGNQRSALATTRSLGRHGLNLFVGDVTRVSLAGSSRYCRTQMRLPDPSDSTDLFIKELAAAITRHHIDVVMPMTDISTATILEYRSDLSQIRLPCPSLESYQAASNKFELFRHAQALGIPVPHTIFVDNDSEFEPATIDLEYPLIIKPAHSHYLSGKQWISTQVQVAYSRDELIQLVNRSSWLQDKPFMVQQFISGHGAGLFALYNHGQPVVQFYHQRIREKPPGGGVSVLSESIPVNEDMRQIADSLLTDLRWHGPAMVEFKVAENGTPYLMEINGRFWGSLQLAIDAGVDFPYLAYLIATGQDIPQVPDYKIGVRNRWLLGDLDRLYLVIKNRNGEYNVRRKFYELFEFMKFFQKYTRYEVNRFDDYRPFLFELKEYVKALFK